MSEQPTQQPQQHRRRGHGWIYIVGFIIIAALAILVVVSLISNGARTPTPVDYQRQANRLHTLRVWGAVWPYLRVGIFVGLLVINTALFRGLVLWLNRKASESHARDGIFPIRTDKVWTRYGQAVVVYDANKMAGPTMIYQPIGRDVVEVKQVFADDVPPAQLQVTSQAQVAQVAAALPDGVADRVADRVLPPTVNVTNDIGALPLLRPELPDVERMDDSHIERLLQEQGELPHILTITEKDDG